MSEPNVWIVTAEDDNGDPVTYRYEQVNTGRDNATEPEQTNDD